MEKYEAGGKYTAPEETVDTLRKAFPYFRIEDCRTDVVRQGNEFAHPFAAEAMSAETAMLMNAQVDLDVPRETLKEARDKMSEMNYQTWKSYNEKHPEWEEFGWWQTYEVPGCPEEPETSVEVLVRHLKGEGSFPTVLVVSVGGLFSNDPYFFTNAPVSKFLGCQIVTARVRVYPDAEYPAAINDLHAVYQWMITNAESLHIDTDCVLIEGASSGGHIAAALPFRLKRYNWCGGPMPRGVVIYEGFFDDRETTRSMRLLTQGWGGLVNRAANMRYMGRNFASGFIGPEAYANHATVEECRGLPPYAIFENQDCPGTDSAFEFMEKLNETGNYCSFLMTGGCTHTGPMEQLNKVGIFYLRENDIDTHLEIDRMSQMESFFVGSIQDFLKYDLRRDTGRHEEE